MLIGSGWAKGLKLKTPKGETTRPTASRVREAILNMLIPDLPDAMFLDLFAGSGAIGIEAVSRGARGAVFVEQGKEALHCLRDNVAELQRRAKAQAMDEVPLVVLGRDVSKALGKELGLHGPFDVIFADPPYADARAWFEASHAAMAAMITDVGVLVVETGVADGDAFEAFAATWQVVKQRPYGDTMVTMLSKVEGG